MNDRAEIGPVGVEPTFPRPERGFLPLEDSPQSASGRNRTHIARRLPVYSRFPVHLVVCVSGKGWTRTSDTKVFSLLLYQLSYLAWSPGFNRRAVGGSSPRMEQVSSEPRARTWTARVQGGRATITSVPREAHDPAPSGGTPPHPEPYNLRLRCARGEPDQAEALSRPNARRRPIGLSDKFVTTYPSGAGAVGQGRSPLLEPTIRRSTRSGEPGQRANL